MSFAIFLPIFFYLIKMTLVSTCLYGYYWFFLRNAAFHRYNRAYLLASTAIALFLPLVPLPAAWPAAATLLVPANLTPSPTTHTGPTPTPGSPASPGGWPLPTLLYIAVAAVLLLRLLPSLFRITLLTRRYPCTRLEGVRFYNTNEPGTPFSFARSLFWINPFFHLTLRELRIVHEFLADSRALSTGNDPGGYAECLVWRSAGAGYSTRLTHSFFHTHLKRRITMIINTDKSPRYLGRMLALPLFLLLFSAFAARQAQQNPSPRMDFLRFYNHHLRYPQAALDANQQGIVSFSIRVDANGKLAAFQALTPDATLPPGHQVLIITVTSRPSTNPSSAAAGQKENLFLEEVQKASQKLGEDDKDKPVPPGEYYVSLTFKIERP